MGGENSGNLGLIENLENVTTETITFILLVSENIKDDLGKSQLAQRLRSQFFIDYGVHLPEVVIRSSKTCADNAVMFLINEINTEQLSIEFNMLRIVNMTADIEGIGIPVVIHKDSAQQNCYWTDLQHKEVLQDLGLQFRTGQDELYQCMATILTKHISEFFGIQETKKMLDKMEEKFPDLLKEVLRNISVQRITEVLQRLLIERISIRNFKLLLESLAQWGGREKDVITLVEHVRGAMARYISHKFSVGNQLRVLMISSEIEEKVRKGVRQNSNGAFLNIEPEIAEEIIEKFSIVFENMPISQKDMIVLTSVDIRRFLKKLLESHFKDLDVMSFGEVTNSIDVKVLKVV